jgi:hypothetical protein
MRVFDDCGQPIYRDYVSGEKLPTGYSIMPFFPGYVFEGGKSIYRGEEVGEGGYVYAEPGMYGNVALLDIASMHPSSLVAEKLFGDEYTDRFADILKARVSIKHKDFDKARKMLGGKLVKYLDDENAASDLAQALKIAINSVYGLTAATFENPFRDTRNKDNIVAKRGALFMVNLKHAVWEKGYRVAHIKTDSIKIPDANPEIIQFVMDYGKEYGYSFEHETVYDRMCLVNDAVYIAKYATAEQCKAKYGYTPKVNSEHPNQWTATGTQFQVPYVFKKLFSHEAIYFDDLCETKSVTSALYLDMNEGLPDVSEYEKTLDSIIKGVGKSGIKMERSDVFDCIKDYISKTGDASVTEKEIEELQRFINKGHNYHFVGKVGRFCPIKQGCGGGLLLRETISNKNGVKGYSAVTGSKGYRWLESEMVQEFRRENDVDHAYYDRLVDEAVRNLSEHGDFEWFVSEDPYVPVDHPEDRPPWA